ncbi:MAG: hypothetical protein QNJ90_05465 [Planctomycetota bacterium]|nr:hypothetical protein [Planctomycetota bacterium]
MLRGVPRLLVLVLCVGLLTPGAHTDDVPFDEAWHALGTRSAQELKQLAAGCHKAKLFAWRNEALEDLLIFEPDDVEARRRLKYRRSPDGAWVQGRYKAPRNLKPASQALTAARGAVRDRFADRARELMEEHASELTAARRDALLRLVVQIAPDREDVRSDLGEVRAEKGAWVLRESAASKARREALRRFAQEALREAPLPSEERPTRADNALRLGFSAIYDTPLARVLGTVEKGELLEATRRIHASRALFAEALPGKDAGLPQLSLYLLAGSSDRDAVLQNHPRSTEAYRAWAKRLQSSWLPKTKQVWIHAAEPAMRLEWCSRQAIGHQLRQRFGIRGFPGWAFEGFGLYLSHLVADQRRTFFVKRTKYGEKGARKDDLWARLREKGADWRAEARTLLASKQAPDLRLLLDKPLNAMNTEDMLASYALCAYLLEGRSQDVPALLLAIGKGKQKSIAALGKLGLDLDTLGIKLRRWLEETA